MDVHSYEEESLKGFLVQSQDHCGFVVVVRCENIFCVPSGLQETGLREGVVAAGVGVVEEGEAWAAGTASTLAANATLTDTAAVTNREWVQ